jgi:hypothetical protein
MMVSSLTGRDFGCNGEEQEEEMAVEKEEEEEEEEEKREESADVDVVLESLHHGAGAMAS